MFDTIMGLMNSPEILAKIFEAIASIVFAANIVTSMTATKVDDGVLGWVMKMMNFLSMNFGKNKNKDG
jgi:hypothetical protein